VTRNVFSIRRSKKKRSGQNDSRIKACIQWRIAPTAGLTVNFWIIFELFYKLRSFHDWTANSVSQGFYSDCPWCLLVKNCVKIFPNLSFWGQKWLFSPGRGAAPSTTIDTYGALPPPYWNPKYATWLSEYYTPSSSNECSFCEL